MSKKDYDRYSLSDNLLKRVIIKADYEGVTNLDSVVEDLKTNCLAEFFKSYRRKIPAVDNGALAVGDPVMRDLPHFFYNYRNSSDVVELSISSRSMTLQINCVEYRNIDPFMSIAINVLDSILGSDSFIVLDKVGIRKIAAYANVKAEKIFGIFEPASFSLEKTIRDIPGAHGLYSSYEDTMFFGKEKHIFADYRRLLKKIKDPKIQEWVLQAILDINAYSVKDSLICETGDLKGHLERVLSNINEVMFTLFKSAVTEGYLENHGKIQ